MAIINGKDEDFETLVEKGLTLVNFSAPWCGPCKMMAKPLEEISEELADKLKIVKIDVDEHKVKATDLGVKGIPAFFVYKDGEQLEMFVGYNPKAELLNKINNHL